MFLTIQIVGDPQSLTQSVIFIDTVFPLIRTNLGLNVKQNFLKLKSEEDLSYSGNGILLNTLSVHMVLHV